MRSIHLTTYPRAHCHARSTFDDPGLPSALLPWWMFWGDPMHGKMRWTMCASDVCFVNEMLRCGWTLQLVVPGRNRAVVLALVMQCSSVALAYVVHIASVGEGRMAACLSWRRTAQCPHA